MNAELENFLKQHFEARKNEAPVMAHALFSSMEYSLFSGGKRFRPQITFAAAKALGLTTADVIPFAAAVEIVHTYSLIHDDLPCMDNDDERRGKPTNHKVYGDAMALLAGDGLLTEAFYVLNKYYAKKSETASRLSLHLAGAAGATGMIAGQVLDIAALAGRPITADDLMTVHNLKTGVLIQVAAFGPAIVAAASEEKTTALFRFGEHLGLAFQLADDLLDYNPNKPEKSGFPALLGVEKTKALLKGATESGLASLKIFGEEANDLRNLLQLNVDRNI